MAADALHGLGAWSNHDEMELIEGKQTGFSPSLSPDCVRVMKEHFVSMVVYTDNDLSHSRNS